METAATARLGIQRRAGALGKASLVAEARRRTGLEDLGDDPFEEGLDAFLASVEADGALTGLGRVVVREECVRLLSNRLEMTDCWRRHPEILESPVPSPIFIVGPPRTASTFLHGILAGTPGLRAPALGEMMDPVRAFRGLGPTRRRRAAFRWFARANPDLAGIHALDLDAPEECTFLTQHSFSSFVMGVALTAPSYVAWLLGRDQTPAYRYHRRQLQLLGHGSSGFRWALKSPAHSFFLDALLRVYPDARIVHLHRDMSDVVASFCSLRESLLGMSSRRVDPRAIGKFSLMALRAGAARSMAERKRAPEAQVMDVRFEDLMGSPLETCERLWSFLRIADAGAAQRAAEESIGRVPPRPGRHRYSLERYGLERHAVERHFRPYSEWSAAVTGASV